VNLNQFIAEEILAQLSYQSTLGQSLKQISLRKTPIDEILKDIARYRASYIDILVQGNLMGSRFKSDDSIMRKYQKTLDTNGGFKQCFNDVLGFRLRFDTYPSEFPDYFRVVDLRNGKKLDDGHRAVHLYYQRDNLAYPIEVQLWCGDDYYFNIWSHQYVYKYKTPTIGANLYRAFSAGTIRNEQEFLQKLKELEANQNG
jgi:putative GTP pyrophosphokinase